MADFIIRYWVQWACGLCAVGITFIVKNYIHMCLAQFQREQETLKQDIIDTVKEELQAQREQLDTTDVELHQAINDIKNNMNSVVKGVLNVQRKPFMDECRRLLESDHEITIEEYELVCEDHQAYNALGGNHDGDTLFNLVKVKYEAQLTK